MMQLFFYRLKITFGLIWCFCIGFTAGFGQEQWELVLPPVPSSNHLRTLFFVDESNGFAAGEYGTILKTNDGGLTWRLIEIPHLNNISDIHFPTFSTSYLVGEDGLILKSVDAGETWQPQPIAFTNNLHRVCFQNEEAGWIIGEKGLILRTTNGGDDWFQQPSGQRTSLNGIAFIGNEAVCIVGDDTTILVTQDEGRNWNKIPIPADVIFRRYSVHFNDVFFLNNQLGWIGGTAGDDKGILLSTNTAGMSWKLVPIAIAEYTDFKSKASCTGAFFCGFQQIYFVDRRYGLDLSGFKDMTDAAASNLPFHTHHAGMQWYSHFIGCSENSTVAGRLAFLSKNRILNTGYGGEFRHSSDGGATWEYPNQNQRQFFRLLIGNQGRLLGIRFASKSQLNWTRSNDFGKHWQEFNPLFFDSQGRPRGEIECNYPGEFIEDGKTLRTMTCLGSAPACTLQVFQSNDFGKNWSYILTSEGPYNHYFTSPHFLTADTLISYHIYRRESTPGFYKAELIFCSSTNGGKTITTTAFPQVWNLIQTRRPLFASKHYFFNGHAGFLVGSEGNIIKTTNTGQSWRNIPSGVVEDLWDITFVNRQTGFVVGAFGRILKTEDSGQTWRKTDSGTQEDIFSIGFKNETEGWAGTETGLLHTTDGGETWQRVPMRYIHGPIREIEFDKDGTGYAYTHKFYPNEDWNSRPGGYILLLVLKEGGVEVAHPKPVSPYSFALHPNYPNPFNSTTIFRFSLPETEAVTLTIYNIRGQRVRTLVDKSLESGEHEVTWNGTNQVGQAVASGVYVARLRRQGEVKTRKVVVLR